MQCDLTLCAVVMWYVHQWMNGVMAFVVFYPITTNLFMNTSHYVYLRERIFNVKQKAQHFKNEVQRHAT
jgi:hypothetical protein